MKHRLLWLSLAIALMMSYSVAYADSITLLPGASTTQTFSVPGTSALSARVVFSLNTAGTMISMDVVNLSPAGSGVDIVSIIWTVSNPGGIVSQTDLLRSGIFLTQNFAGAGQSGGLISVLNRPLLDGLINPQYQVGFRLSNGQPVIVPGTNEVPEPTTLLLLGTGLFGVVAKARRRRKS